MTKSIKNLKDKFFLYGATYDQDWDNKIFTIYLPDNFNDRVWKLRRYNNKDMNHGWKVVVKG